MVDATYIHTHIDLLDWKFDYSLGEKHTSETDHLFDTVDVLIDIDKMGFNGFNSTESRYIMLFQIFILYLKHVWYLVLDTWWLFSFSLSLSHSFYLDIIRMHRHKLNWVNGWFDACIRLVLCNIMLRILNGMSKK